MAGPGTVAAQKSSSGDQADVGLALFPFEVERSEDRSMAFALEAAVDKTLADLIGHPVHTGRSTNRALRGDVADCTADVFCLRLFGDQFNSSLAVRVRVYPVPGEIQVETEWYSTGDGTRLGRENTAFDEGDNAALASALAAWWQFYWEASLQARPGAQAEVGTVLTESSSEREARQDNQAAVQNRRREDPGARRRADSVTRRREDPGARRDEDVDSSSDDLALFDRDDPTAHLRSLAGEERDDRDRDSSKKRKAKKRRSEPEPEQRWDDDPAVDLDEPDRSESRRDARDDRSSRRDREPRRTERRKPESSRPSARTPSRSSRPAADVSRGEFSFHRRFYLRVGGTFPTGHLNRRHYVYAYLGAGGAKEQEVGWERLGLMPAFLGDEMVSPPSGGGTVSFGYAFLPFVAAEVDVTLMLGSQSLRREYERVDGRTNANENGGAGPAPNTQATLNVVADIRARFFVFPERRFKLTPGIGLSILGLPGFTMYAETTFSYSDRPATAVVGLTPIFGFNVGITEKVSFFLDTSFMIYLHSGLADAGPSWLPEETAGNLMGTTSYVDQPPGPPDGSVPMRYLLRVGAGVAFAF